MDEPRELVADISTVGNNRLRVRRRLGLNRSSEMASEDMPQGVKLLNNDPPSALNAMEVSLFKTLYGLSSSLTLRLPLSSERAADAGPDEIVVYELNFAAGLQNSVPSLVAKMASHLAIAPGQFTPSAWRLLIAFQAFGELESIAIGVEEIMFAYYILRFSADPGRYSLHTRNHPPLAIDFEAPLKKKIEMNWRERYVFMKVGLNPGFPTSWFLAGGKTKAKLAGKAGASEVIKHQSSHRSVEFLTSKFALENTTIWGFDMSNGQRCSTADAYSRFVAASGKLVEANPSVPLLLAADSGDEVQCIDGFPATKRKAYDDTATSSLAKRPKTVCDDQTIETTTTPGGLVTGTASPPLVEELKSKILSHDFKSLVTSGASCAVDGVYSNLVKAMSTFFMVEKKLASSISVVANERQIVEGLRRQLDNEASRAASAHAIIVSKESDITRLNMTVQERGMTITDLQSKVTSLVSEKELLQREIVLLRKRVDTVKHEREFYRDGATIIARWETMREYLLGEHKKWKLDDMDSQYRHVMEDQARFKGMPAPVFDESLIDIDARNQVD